MTLLRELCDYVMILLEWTYTIYKPLEWPYKPSMFFTVKKYSDVNKSRQCTNLIYFVDAYDPELRRTIPCMWDLRTAVQKAIWSEKTYYTYTQPSSYWVPYLSLWKEIQVEERLQKTSENMCVAGLCIERWRLNTRFDKSKLTETWIYIVLL